MIFGKSHYGISRITLSGVDVGGLCWTRSKDVLNIENINLHDAHRGQGIGTQLLREALQVADEAKAAVCLNAFYRPDKKDGGDLIRLYTKMGFQIDCIDDQGYAQMDRAPGAPMPSLEPVLLYMAPDTDAVFFQNFDGFDEPLATAFVYDTGIRDFLWCQVDDPETGWRSASEDELDALRADAQHPSGPDWVRFPILNGIGVSREMPDFAKDCDLEGCSL